MNRIILQNFKRGLVKKCHKLLLTGKYRPFEKIINKLVDVTLEFPIDNRSVEIGMEFYRDIFPVKLQHGFHCLPVGRGIIVLEKRADIIVHPSFKVGNLVIVAVIQRAYHCIGHRIKIEDLTSVVETFVYILLGIGKFSPSFNRLSDKIQSFTV